MAVLHLNEQGFYFVIVIAGVIDRYRIAVQSIAIGFILTLSKAVL